MPACDTDKQSIVALTGRQRLALSLAKAGYSHAEIADKLGLRHRESATQLIQRARAAEKAFQQAVVDFIA